MAKKKKHLPDVEFIANHSLSDCVDKLEYLAISLFAQEINLRIEVKPIDREKWVFEAQKKVERTHEIIEARGSLLKMDDLTTLVTIDSYVSEKTMKVASAGFIILLIVFLGLGTFFLYLHSYAIAIFIISIGLMWLIRGLVEGNANAKRQEQLLRNHIKRSLD